MIVKVVPVFKTIAGPMLNIVIIGCVYLKGYRWCALGRRQLDIAKVR